jgi:tetratricopeptide (TPR) repeat protein
LEGSSPIASLEVLVLEEGERVAITALSRLGRENLSKQDIETAIQDFSFALEQDPDDRRVLCLRGDAYIRSGDLSAGESDFERAMQEANADDLAMALRWRGLSFRQIDRREAALADFDASIAAAPSHQAFFYRGLLRGEMGRLDESLADLERAVELKPDDDDYLSHRAEVMAAVGRVAESEDEFRRIELRFPDNSHNYLLWVGSLMRRDLYEEALAVAERAVLACPEVASIRLASARANAATRRFGRAQQELDAAAELGAAAEEVSHLRGKVLRDLERFDDAEAAFTVAAEGSWKYQHLALADRFVVLRQLDRPAEALDINRAIELSPSTAEFWVERGCLKMAAYPETDVLSDLARGLELDPRSVSGYLHLARYHFNRREHDLAIQAANHALDLGTETMSRRSRARALFWAQRWDEAASAYSEILDDQRDDEDLLWQLAACYANGGRFADAEAIFKQLIQREPANISAAMALAVTVSQQGRSEEAVELFRSRRATFGDDAEHWIDGSLHPTMLPLYDVVIADWNASASSPS